MEMTLPISALEIQQNQNPVIVNHGVLSVCQTTRFWIKQEPGFSH